MSIIDLFDDELDTATEFGDADLLVFLKDPAGTPENLNIAFSNFIADWRKRFSYRISRTISSNNLVVALKNSSDADPSTTRPLYFEIDGVTRKVTAALSVQVNAGTSVFALGGSAFLNLMQELFVYVGWRASTSTVFILLSRMPGAREYAEFSSTSTDERYGAYSGAAPAATDKVQNIGKFTIQNSGTASFNWSIPSYDNVVNRPIYRTSWLSWSPTFSGFSANPTGVHLYMIENNTASVLVRHSASGTSNANNFTISLPFTAKTITNMAWGGACGFFDNGAASATPGVLRVLSAATVMEVGKTWDGNFTSWTTSSGKRLTQMSPLFYEIGVV